MKSTRSRRNFLKTSSATAAAACIVPGLSANIDKQGDSLLVPELKARVSILDLDYKPIVELGSDVDRINADKGNTIRQDEKQWQDGKFVHPHDACFDNQGNIFVAEWVGTGRVTKLKKV